MAALINPQVPVERMVEVLAEGQSNVKTSAFNPKRSIYRSMREKDRYKDVPHSVYFYYIRVNRSGRLEVSHYFYPHVDKGKDPKNPENWKPIPHTDKALRDIITTLAINARPIKRPKKKGEERRVRDPARGRQRFESIVWQHKSYAVFFVDEVNWKFHNPPKSDPVVFLTQGKDSKHGRPNWSFFDAMNFPDIKMPIAGSTNKDERSAIAFINHMKANDAGRDIGRDMDGKPLPRPEPAQLFQFQMYLDVFFANGTSKMTVILDPDGNNLGPPIGPP